MNKLVVLSGCSGGGKSTLIEELSQCGYAVSEEVGRKIVRQYGEMDPVVRCELIIQHSIDAYHEALKSGPLRDDVIFFDRSFMEGVSYLQSVGRHEYDSLINDLRFYHQIFMVPPWKEIFHQDNERKHGFDEAVLEYRRCMEFYPKYGYKIIEIPKVDVNDRIRFIFDVLKIGNKAEIIGGQEKVDIVIADYDKNWPVKFAEHKRKIIRSLGEKVIQIEHIGSTAVPGLSAKPIIDILLIVENSGKEAAYLFALERSGYILRAREPEFYEHRLMRTPEKDVHIHIFSPDSPEIERYLLFRNRLRECPEDRKLYENTKRKLAMCLWPDMQAYADAKISVIEAIIAAARSKKFHDL